MKYQSTEIHVRSASLGGGDIEFILAAWDSTLPFLASIGAGEMWGDEPFSQREGQQQEITEIIRQSEEDPQNDFRRLLVAEVNAPAEGTAKTVPVGAAIVRDALPYYLLERPELKGEIEKADSLLFIEVLITDHRAHRRHQGAGAALVEAIKRRTRSSGKSAVYVDAWAGNGRKLNNY
ncbi:GNAT family protein [Xylaria flabelliformis]|nr:GNAT family protein [Xylaria flabelliformis]